MNKMALALAVAVLASLGGIALGGKEHAPGQQPVGNFEDYASVFWRSTVLIVTMTRQARPV